MCVSVQVCMTAIVLCLMSYMFEALILTQSVPCQPKFKRPTQVVKVKLVGLQLTTKW